MARKSATSTEEIVMPRSRRKPAEEKSSPRRSRKAAVEEAPVEKPARRSRKAAVEEAPVAFNPYSDLDTALDKVEAHVGLVDAGLDSSERRMSSGLLALDLVYGGGLTAGWYTNAGQEQCCKTTAAVTALCEAVNDAVPIIYYMDFEGCYTISTELETNFGKVPFRDILDQYGLPHCPDKEKQFFPIEGLAVPTVDRMVNVDKLYFSGVRPITRMTTESGRSFEGYAHPFLCRDSEGNLVYKTLEALREGDLVIVKVGD